MGRGVHRYSRCVRSLAVVVTGDAVYQATVQRAREADRQGWDQDKSAPERLELVVASVLSEQWLTDMVRWISFEMDDENQETARLALLAALPQQLRDLEQPVRETRRTDYDHDLNTDGD